MKKLFTQFGMDDGEGNISTTRLIVMLAALTVLLPHFIAGCKGEPLPWTPDDWKILAVALGGKVAQSFSENAETNPASTK